MRYWIHPWRTQTVHDHSGHLGKEFGHTANKELGKVEPGDWLCAYNFWNKHHLFRPLGAMIVAARAESDPKAAHPGKADFSSAEATRILGVPVWKDEQDPGRTRHVFARRGTVMRFDLWTPEEEQLERIEFANGDGPFVKDGHIYVQTYRHVREVSRPTAEWLHERLTLGWPVPLR